MAQTQDLYTYLHSYKSRLQPGSALQNFNYSTDSTLQDLFNYVSTLTTPEAEHYWSSLFLIICEDKGPFCSLFDKSLFNQYFNYALTKVYSSQDPGLLRAYADCIDGVLTNEIIYLDEINDTPTIVSIVETWMPYESCFGNFEYTYKKFVEIAVASWWDKIREFNEGDHPGDDIVNVVHQLLVVQNAGIDVEDYAEIFADSVFEYIDYLNGFNLENNKVAQNREAIQRSHEILNEFEACKTSDEVKENILKYRTSLNKFYAYVPPVQQIENLRISQRFEEIKQGVNFINKSFFTMKYPSKYTVQRGNLTISVYEGTCNQNNNQVRACIKVYISANNSMSDLEKAFNEIKVYQRLSDLSRPDNCFLKYYGSYYENNSIHMIMDWYDFNLMDYIHNLQTKNYVFAEINYLQIIHKLLASFALMAENGILHNDIKPHNMLVDENWNIKIIDFDTSLLKIQDTSFSMTGTYKIQGTAGYLAPEQKAALNRGQNQAAFNREKADVYSLGLVFYQLLFYKNVQELTTNNFYSDIEKLQNFSVETKRFLKIMLTENPSQRPLFREALAQFKGIPMTKTFTS